jgi:hypothetical protein
VRATAIHPWYSPRSTENGGISLGYPGAPSRHYPFQIYASGTIELKFSFERNSPPFDDKSLREEWITRLRRIPGFEEKGGIEGLPVIRVRHLVDPAAMLKFMEMLDWMEKTLAAG